MMMFQKTLMSPGVPQEDVHDEEQETVLAPAVPGLLSLPGSQSVSQSAGSLRLNNMKDFSSSKYFSATNYFSTMTGLEGQDTNFCSV